MVKEVNNYGKEGQNKEEESKGQAERRRALNKRASVVLLILFLLFFLLELFSLTSNKLYEDDGYTLLESSKPFPQLLNDYGVDASPIGYYVVFKFFHLSVITARILNIILLFGSAIIIFKIFNEYWKLDEATIYLSLAVFMFNPDCMMLVMELRTYILLLFLIFISYYLLLKAIMNQDSKSFYVSLFFGCLSCLFHYFAILYLLGIGLYVLVNKSFIKFYKGINKSWNYAISSVVFIVLSLASLHESLSIKNVHVANPSFLHSIQFFYYMLTGFVYGFHLWVIASFPFLIVYIAFPLIFFYVFYNFKVDKKLKLALPFIPAIIIPLICTLTGSFTTISASYRYSFFTVPIIISLFIHYLTVKSEKFKPFILLIMLLLCILSVELSNDLRIPKYVQENHSSNNYIIYPPYYYYMNRIYLSENSSFYDPITCSFMNRTNYRTWVRSWSKNTNGEYLFSCCDEVALLSKEGYQPLFYSNDSFSENVTRCLTR